MIVANWDEVFVLIFHQQRNSDPHFGSRARCSSRKNAWFGIWFFILDCSVCVCVCDDTSVSVWFDCKFIETGYAVFNRSEGSQSQYLFLLIQIKSDKIADNTNWRGGNERNGTEMMAYSRMILATFQCQADFAYFFSPQPKQNKTNRIKPNSFYFYENTIKFNGACTNSSDNLSKYINFWMNSWMAWALFWLEHHFFF